MTASVFGVTSPKIRMTMVSRPVATAMPVSPERRRPMRVASAEAAMLTKVLPSRMSPMRRSGRCNEAPAADQQRGVHEPCRNRQNGLVREVLGEDVVDIQDTAQERETLQHEGHRDHLEQQGLHGLERRQRADEAARALVVEVAVLHGEQDGLARGDAEQAV